MRIGRLVLLATLAAPLSSVALQPPRPVIVPDEAICAACQIRERAVVSLGDTVGDGQLTRRPLAVAVDNGGRYFVADEASPPLIFGRDGRFIRLLGRRGQGPGEFGRGANVVFLKSSVVVADFANARLAILDTSLTFRRHVPVSFTFGSLTPHGDTLLVAGLVPLPQSAGLPVHLVDLSSNSVKVLRSMGLDAGNFTDPAAGWTLSCQLSAGHNGSFWSLDRLRYRVVKWGAGGTPQLQLIRQPSWMSDSTAGLIGGPSTPPQPFMLGIREDSAGLIWTIAAVPSNRWQNAWTRVTRGTTSVRASDVDTEELYDTMVEVIDPVARRVVARKVIAEIAVSLLPANRVAFYTVSSSGIPTITIKELTVER